MDEAPGLALRTFCMYYDLWRGSLRCACQHMYVCVHAWTRRIALPTRFGTLLQGQIIRISTGTSGHAMTRQAGTRSRMIHDVGTSRCTTDSISGPIGWHHACTRPFVRFTTARGYNAPLIVRASTHPAGTQTRS